MPEHEPASGAIVQDYLIQCGGAERVALGASSHFDRSCRACGGTRLQQSLAVGGDLGSEGLVPTTTRFGTALSDLVKCLDCGHGQLAAFPDAEDLSEGYATAESADYLHEEAGQRTTARAALERVQRYAGPGRLLEVGCWVGFLLDEARSRGWEVMGIEPSTFASAYARDHLGLDVRTAELFDVEPERGLFDAVVLADVIEHLPEPGAALDRIASLVRPGGVLYLALPNAGSLVARASGRRWWSVIPTHMHYFTRKSLTELLARHGWEVLEVGTAPKAFTVRYYFERLAGYSVAVSRSLVWIAGRAGLAERSWAPDFRDRMAVVATRSTPAGPTAR